MKKLFSITSLTIICLTLQAQDKIEEQKRDFDFYRATESWFSAWKLVRLDIYHIYQVKPVEFVFFDDKYVYSTSKTTVPEGTSVKGCNLINLKFKWKRALHNDTILLPDRSIMPVNLTSFAAALPDEINKAFFVMPLPRFWEQSGTKSNGFGLDNLNHWCFYSRILAFATDAEFWQEDDQTGAGKYVRQTV